MEQLELWPMGETNPHNTAMAQDPVPSNDAAGMDSALRQAAWLTSKTNKFVWLTYHENRSTMLSCTEKSNGLHLRLHKAFKEADGSVWEALAAFLTGDTANPVLGAFIAQLRPAKCPTTQVQTKGRFYDLQVLFDHVNETYFHHACKVSITWGHAGPKHRRRSIQLGSFTEEDQLIRIHPCLDQAFVPQFYVAWIIFHEILHEVFGLKRSSKRKVFHTKEFVALEQSFPDYVKCKAWEKKNLPRLLNYRHKALR